jgi:hypothetical protein
MEMASFPKLRRPAEPSDKSEGIRMFRVLALAIAAAPAAVNTAVAPSELATLRGASVVCHTPNANLARALQASQPAASLVGSPVLSERVAA